MGEGVKHCLNLRDFIYERPLIPYMIVRPSPIIWCPDVCISKQENHAEGSHKWLTFNKHM